MAEQRSRRHHYVPQLVLRGFADEREQVRTEDLVTGGGYVQSVRKAAAENDYNTLRRPDGATSDLAERAIAEVEAAAAPPLARIAAGQWLDNEAERHAVAHFLGLQYVRVPGRREFTDQMADLLLKLTVAAGGPARLRELMRERGADPTDDEVLAKWKGFKDFASWSVTMRREHHVFQSLRLMEYLAPMLAFGYTWCVVHWERRTLLTCDSPLVLVQGPNHPPGRGIGVATSGLILFPINRRCLLVLVHKDLREVPEGTRPLGTFANARRYNRLIASHARRWLYLHPSDTRDDLLGPDFDLSVPPDRVLDPDLHADLQSSLADMGEWAFRHPDQPHPMARLQLPPKPPQEARPPRGFWPGQLDARRHLPDQPTSRRDRS